MRERVLCWGSGIGLTVAVVASVAAQSAPGPTTVTAPTPTIDDAIKQAASAGKPLVIELSTDWCSACKVFEKRTLPDANVQIALGDVMFVRYDGEATPGIEVARKYDVHVYPTFIALDDQGIAVLRVEGALGASSFVQWIRNARAASESEASMRASLANKPSDPSVAISAARWYALRSRTREALGEYDRLAKLATATPTQRAEAARTARHVRRVEQWKQTLLADTFAAIASDPAHVTADELAIATVGSGVDAKSVRAAIKSALDARTDPAELNDLVYVAIAAGLYDEAVRAGERMVKNKRTAELLDTYAEALFKSGDKAKALAIADEALALADAASKKSLEKNRVRFDAGSGDADEVVRIKTRTKDLWARLSKADELVDRMIAQAQRRAPSTPEVDDELVAYQKLLAETSRALARACRASSGAEMEGHVRLKFDASGGIISYSIMLDESAPKALRKCLAKELTTLTLKVPKRTTKETLAIEFR